MKKTTALSLFLILGAAFVFVQYPKAISHAWLWLKVELPWLSQAMQDSLARLSLAMGIATLLGLIVGSLLRLHVVLEELFTPWLLTLLAMPWLAIIVLLNLLWGLTETAARWVGVLAAAPHIAYAMRPLSTPKSLVMGLLRAYRLLFFAIALAELLGRDTGIGSQIRFFFLYWNPPRLVAYGLLLILLWFIGEMVTRLIMYLLMRTIRMRQGSLGTA